MPRYARVFALAIAHFASQLAVAAPVPPARIVTAEAVVKPPRGKARDLAVKLTSAPFLGGIARSKHVAALSCLSGEKNPNGWLASRLRVTVDENRGTVAIRLVDCPRRDAVALLSAVVEAYKTDTLGIGQAVLTAQYERAMVVQALVLAQQPNAGGVPVNINFTPLLIENTGALSKAEVDSSVVQAPRILMPAPPSR